MSSPTVLTLKKLREQGYTAQVVERWQALSGNKFLPGIRIDLFGIIDILAIRGDEDGCLGVQCTTYSNMSARVKKAKAEPRMVTWLCANNQLQVWGWFKKKNRWEVRVVEITGDDL